MILPENQAPSRCEGPNTEGGSIPPPPEWKKSRVSLKPSVGVYRKTKVRASCAALLPQSLFEQAIYSPPSINLETGNPAAIVAKDHLFRRSTHLCYPTRVFSRGERQRDERVTNRVLTSIRNSCFPKRGSPHPFMKPLLRQRPSLTVSEDEIVRTRTYEALLDTIKNTKNFRSI